MSERTGKTGLTRKVEKGMRAQRVVLTERSLRSLSKQTHPGNPPKIFEYDAVVPGLNVLWTPTYLGFGMTKRWPGKKSPTWRALGGVYLPADGDERFTEEEITGGR